MKRCSSDAVVNSISSRLAGRFSSKHQYRAQQNRKSSDNFFFFWWNDARYK